MSYYNPEDLKRFGEITRFAETAGSRFFDYYNTALAPGMLSAREKSLIALAVAHVVQCPYCIDVFTTACLENGSDEEQMMEAVHVSAAIRGGASLVHAVQMMNRAEKLGM
jgi:alkylhydroperoxidase/carboxymuconolactone decarboxylase family protein